MKGMSFTETTSTLETGEQKRATRDGQTGWPCSRADALMQRHGDDQPILFPPAVSFVRNARRRAVSGLVAEKSKRARPGGEVGKLEWGGVDGRGMGDEMMHSWWSRLAIWRSWAAVLIGSYHPD